MKQVVIINRKTYNYVGFGELGHIFQPIDGGSPIIRSEAQIAHFNLTYFPTPVMQCGFAYPQSLYR